MAAHSQGCPTAARGLAPRRRFPTAAPTCCRRKRTRARSSPPSIPDGTRCRGGRRPGWSLARCHTAGSRRSAGSPRRLAAGACGRRRASATGRTRACKTAWHSGSAGWRHLPAKAAAHVPRPAARAAAGGVCGRQGLALQGRRRSGSGTPCGPRGSRGDAGAAEDGQNRHEVVVASHGVRSQDSARFSQKTPDWWSAEACRTGDEL